jgi:hypothetical protein
MLPSHSSFLHFLSFSYFFCFLSSFLSNDYFSFASNCGYSTDKICVSLMVLICSCIVNFCFFVVFICSALCEVACEAAVTIGVGQVGENDKYERK